MPINQDEPLSIDEIFQAAEGQDVSTIADGEALRQEFVKKFDYDPEVSLWDESELKKRQAAERLKRQAERNAAELAKFHQSESRTKIGMDDMDNLGAIGVGIGSLNFKQMSSTQIEDKILSIVPKLAPKKSQQARKYMEDKTRKPKVYAPDATNELIKIARTGTATNQKPKDTNIIEPTQDQGNKYTNAVKRGAASTIQTVALLHDFGYLGVEKVLEAAGGKNIGQPINSSLEPTTNRLFKAMEDLKTEKYTASQSMTNLTMGADEAGKQAGAEDKSETWAAIKYMMENGSLGDVGEILAETVPSLAVGFGVGGVARKTVGAAAERAVARRAGMLARRAGEVVDPKRLASFAAPVGGAIQGATIAGTTDFVGSAGSEYSRAYQEGKNMGDAVDYAMRRSLVQAGVSGIGGSFLPFTFGNRLFTSIGQSTIQGVAGYASAAAGAAAVGEELSPSEAAMNTLMGAITALPEVIAVGAGEGISKQRIITEVENGLLETALQSRAMQEDEQNIKAGYFAGVMNNLIDRVKESKTAGRSDDTLREYINQVREDSGSIDSVYVDVDTFNQTLADHNIPLEDLFEMNPDLRDQWERVEDINGTIRIPLDELLSMAYKIDNEPLLRQLVGAMRSEPTAPNAYEAGASLSRSSEEIKSDVARITENYENIRQGQKEIDSVEQLIKNDLKALDYGFEAKTGFNDQASTLVGAMYESLAAKTGKTVKQLYDEMPVRIVSNADQAEKLLGTMGQNETFNQNADTTIDKLIPTNDLNKNGQVLQVGEGGFNILHGSPNKAMDLNSIEIVRQGQKQGKKNRVYGGLYGTLETDINQATEYSKMGDTDGSVYDLRIKPGTKVLNKAGDITRLSEAFINEQIAAGVGVIYGTDPRGRTEFAVIDKNAIESVNARDQKEIFNQQLNDAIDRELIAIHEIKPEGLLHADKMGGLAVPSLGVVNRDNLTTGFGDITLIAPTTLIDPKGYAKPKVYGADIYSPRYPEVEYQFDKKGITEFDTSLDGSREFLESNKHFDEMTDRPHRILMDSPEVAHKFLTEQGVVVEKVYKDQIVKSMADDNQYQMPMDLWTNIMAEGGLADFSDLIDLDGNFDPAALVSKLREDPDQFNRAYRAFVDAKTQRQVLKARAERTRGILEQADNQARGSFLYSAFDDLRNILNGRTPKPAETESIKKVYDRQGTVDSIREAIQRENLADRFRQYVEGIVRKNLKGERIFNGYTPAGKRKYVEHDLGNVVKILKKDLVGGESFNYGMGSIRAKFTPQLKSLRAIKDHASRLVNKEQFSQVKDQVNAIYSDLQERTNEYGTFDGWNNFDEALKEIPGYGLDGALKRNGFKEVPAALKAEIAGLIKTLADMPTEYFEAKIERAVRLDEFAGAVVPRNSDASIIKALERNGIKDIRFYDEQTPRKEVIAGFADQFFQNADNNVRGQIQFRKDKKGAVVIMGKNANFSTFAHEMGHHFLELNMMFANRPDADGQLKADMDAVMQWAGLDPDSNTWAGLNPEQRTEIHEKFAESFEQYMFTGKAPSNKLRQVFARFRSFMAAVYKNMGRFMGINKRADLNSEITAVMDRMLATQDAIDQVQSQRNLEMAITPEMAKDLGIPDDEYADMVQSHKDATEAAINELEQKTIKDLGWYRNLRNKHMAAFTAQAKRIRQSIREDVAEVVGNQPVYQAIAFLKQPVEKVEKVRRNPDVIDDTRDNLLEAIAKMGGIDADEIGSTWGIDQPESYKVNVGRVKKVARKGGLSIETVAERLAEHGYLDKDQYGRFDTRQLEDLFTDSVGGATYYSMNADHGLFEYSNDYGLAWDEVVEFPVSGKLNLEWLKAKYGEDSEIYKSIPKNGKYGLTAADGLDPEMVAERFGYTSADQMIREMVEAKPPKEVIEEMANNQIEAQHSDLFDEASVEQAIDEAVHNDIRSQMLARELAAVGKMNGKQAELNQSAKLAAADIISKTNIGDIRPHVYSATELRLSRQYDKALKSGNTVEAARIKRSQLINFHATKLAYQVLNEVKGLETLAKTINGNDARLAKNRDFNIVTIARYVLAQYDVLDLQVNVIEQLKAIRDYDPTAYSEVADLSGVGLTDKDTLTFTSLIDKDDVNSMTYDEFQTLNDVVRQLWFKSKENQKIRVGNEKVDLAIAVENLVSTADKKPAKARESKYLDGRQFKWERALQTTRRAEQFFKWLDGGKANGFFHQYIFNRIQDGLAAYRIEQKKMYVNIRDIYKEFDHSYTGKIDAPELGGTKSVFDTKYELIHAILHSGNESNKKRMVLGFGWGEKLEGGSVDYSKWDNFVARMFGEGVITKKDMDAVQKIWNTFDGYKKQAQEVHKAMNGLYFKELPKSIVNTPFGMYEGGYIPADYDKNATPDAEVLGLKNEASTQAEGFATAGVTTGANFTKSRVESFNGLPLNLDLSTLPMHLDRELRYIHLERELKQASKILRNKELIRSMDRASPYSMVSITKDWLETVANQRMYEPSKMGGLDRVVNTLKRNVGITFMAGNFKNAIEAMTSITQVAVAVPKTELLVSTGKFFVNALSRESMTADVRALSPFMESRLNRSADEARYQIDQFVVNPSKLKKVNDFLIQHSYIVQQVIQDPLEVISWNAAYNDAQTKKGMNQADAVHHADGVVRMYLNDMSPEGISKLERGGPLVRAMLMFYGWFNMVSNSWRMNRQFINENPELGRIGKMGAHAALYTMMIALPSILSKALTLTFNGDLLDNEDPEDWEEDAVMILGKSQFEMILGMMPFTRDIVNPIYKQTTATTSFVDKYSVSPIQSMGDTLIKTGKTAIKGYQNIVLDGENEIDKSKATKELLQSATFATGIPFAIVQRPATYGVDVLVDEDQEPENAGEVVRGVLSGK